VEEQGSGCFYQRNAADWLRFQWLDWQRHRLLLWDEQSGFNRDGRADYRDSRFYPDLNSNSDANPMRSTMTTRFDPSSAGRSKWTSMLGVVLSTATIFGPIRVALSQTPEYAVTELTGEDATQVPSKLNNLGVIVGRKAGDGKGAQRAAVWSNSHSNGKHLGAFVGGDYSSATGINDTGEITGASNTATAILPFLWTEKAGYSAYLFYLVTLVDRLLR